MQAALPLGVNPIRIERGLTTSALGIFIPFTTQELFQKSEGALYYGVNSLSHNMILVDRKLLSNPNGLILGTPGSPARARDCCSTATRFCLLWIVFRRTRSFTG